MWLATKMGFFSIVINTRNTNENDAFIVRARKREDLNIAFPQKQVIRTTDSDYAVRVQCSQVELNQLFQDFASTIDYPNFKGEIAKTESQKDKVSFYSKIWSIMNEYQGLFEKGIYNRFKHLGYY